MTAACPALLLSWSLLSPMSTTLLQNKLPWNDFCCKLKQVIITTSLVSLHKCNDTRIWRWKSADTYVAKNLNTLQTEQAISYYQSLALFFLSPPNIHGRSLPLPSAWFCQKFFLLQGGFAFPLSPNACHAIVGVFSVVLQELYLTIKNTLRWQISNKTALDWTTCDL